jgi:hypothetical protein
MDLFIDDASFWKHGTKCAAFAKLTFNFQSSFMAAENMFNDRQA